MALNKNQKIIALIIAILVLFTIVLLTFTLPKILNSTVKTSNTQSAVNSVSIPPLSLSKINIDIEACKILSTEIAKKYLGNDVENIANTKFTNLSSCAYKDSLNNTIGINITEQKDQVEADLNFETIKKTNPKLENLSELKDKVAIDINTYQLNFQKNKYTGSISIVKNANSDIKNNLIDLYKDLVF